MLCDRCIHALNCPAKAEHGGAIRCSAYKPQEMTNEDWLRSLNTEQLAEVLLSIRNACWECGDYGKPKCPFGECVFLNDDVIKWLKEKHDE